MQGLRTVFGRGPRNQSDVLGRVVRTVFLLEYLSNARLREQITATTNKVEAYNGFAKWLNFGGEGVIDTADPVEQEKHLKHNHLVANAAAVQNSSISGAPSASSRPTATSSDARTWPSSAPTRPDGSSASATTPSR